MSQWGIERAFKRGDTLINVMPHVYTDAFEPAKPYSEIDSLHLTHVEGSKEIAQEMMRELSIEYEGKPYRKWCVPPTVM